MVEDRLIDLLDDTGHLQFVARRCVQCGEIVDPVILSNRDRSITEHDVSQKGPLPAVAPTNVDQSESDGQQVVSRP